jgi:hypothetical protein
MKLSVSVPDELWEASRTQRPDLNPSHLVQEALEVWTRSHVAPPFSLERPDDAGDAFALVREHLAGQAREEFERGYRAALEAAEVLDFWVIESLAKQHFDVVAWAEGFASSEVQADMDRIPRDRAPGTKIIGPLLKALGNVISPWGDDAFGPSAPYLRGFAQAMRDLWEEAFEGTVSRSGSASGSQSRSRSRAGSGSYSRSKSGSASGSKSTSRSEGRTSVDGDAADPALNSSDGESGSPPANSEEGAPG